MKLFKFTLFVFAAGVLMFFSNCKKDEGDGPTPEEERTELLTGTWVVPDNTSVNVPDATATTSDQWANFEVTFSASNINTSGHPAGAGAVWPSGTWEFGSNVNTIVREDGVSMTILTINETTLSVTFTVEGEELGGGKVAALDGDYTFNLVAE